MTDLAVLHVFNHRLFTEHMQCLMHVENLTNMRKIKNIL